MKHTNFSLKISEIERQEYKELLRAVQLHGGCVEWNNDEDIEGPLIAVNPDSCAPDPVDVNIYKVEIINDRLKFYGLNKKDDQDVDFDETGIFAGGLSTIIDYIPAIHGINDVAIDQNDYKEAIADIAYLLGQYQVSISNNSRYKISKIIEWTDEFMSKHAYTDWSEVEYIDEIYAFAMNKFFAYKGYVHHNCTCCGQDVLVYEKDESKARNPYTLTCENCSVEITGANAIDILLKSKKVPYEK